MADRTVTVIQPRLHLPSLSQESGKQRVAAYARVSTDSVEQMGSVEAQKDYFEKLIQKRPDWEFAGIYADEGISGTSLNRRDVFNRIIPFFQLVRCLQGRNYVLRVYAPVLSFPILQKIPQK